MQHERYIARLCWNTRDWVRPSGDARLVEQADTYTSTVGFGHEEWLFNYAWLLDGWKYAFLQPVNRSLQHVQGKIIDVLLFTIGGKQGWLYVGEIRRCEVLTEELARFAWKQARQRGWLQAMEEHVRAVDGDVRALKGDDPRLIFNVRFRRRDALLYDPPVPVPGGDFIRKIRRYALVAAKQAPAGLDAQWARRVAATKDRPTGKVRRRGVPDTEADLVHHAMQNELARALRRKYGSAAVRVEEDFVDIRVQVGRRLIFIEVKPDPRPRRAIREALGQLMEYEFVGARSGNAPTELIVVGPGEPAGMDLAYLRRLRTRWLIPIKYVTATEGGEVNI